jgi:hypothetical protein
MVSPATTTAAPPSSVGVGAPRPSTTEVTIAPSGRTPANSPARSGPRRGRASYQRRKAPALTTVLRYSSAAASLRLGGRSIELPSATAPATSSMGTAMTWV